MIGSGVIAVKIHVMYTKSWTLILSDNLVTINFFNLAVKWLNIRTSIAPHTNEFRLSKLENKVQTYLALLQASQASLLGSFQPMFLALHVCCRYPEVVLWRGPVKGCHSALCKAGLDLWLPELVTPFRQVWSARRSSPLMASREGCQVGPWDLGTSGVSPSISLDSCDILRQDAKEYLLVLCHVRLVTWFLVALDTLNWHPCWFIGFPIFHSIVSNWGSPILSAWFVINSASFHKHHCLAHFTKCS